MTFSLILARRPPSSNSHGSKLFRADLRQLAALKWAGQPLLKGRLSCRITWLHTVPTSQGVDNIAKCIIDALKGVVFDDDNAVVRCLLTKVDTTGAFVFDSAYVGTNDYNAIDAFLRTSEPHVLSIEVCEVGFLNLRFGLIEGDMP